MARLHSAGIEVAMITSENTELVARRAAKLKIKHLFQGVQDKQRVVEGLIDELQLGWPSVAYIGDDINCFGLLSNVGIAACPNNAVSKVKAIPNIIHLKKKGGDGVVRELAEEIMISKN